MRGVILAGGTGSRLDPLTRVTNKHLLPVYDRPMIHHAIQCLAAAGFQDVMVVCGGENADSFEPLLKDGAEFGVRLAYAYQEEARGIADALGLARNFANDEDVCVLLGDNIFEHSLRGPAERFAAQGGGARVLLTEVEHPEHYGVAQFEGGRLTGIVEKPAGVPPSRLAVTGCYFYDRRVFEIVPTLVPSGRGELEITDVNNAYLAAGRLEWEIVPGYWADCGESIDGLFAAQRLVADRGVNNLPAE